MAVLALVVGAQFWPARFGGDVAFLSTVGTSMQPSIREGDLAIVRAAPPYAVGDVVAFRHGDLRQVALHRIIEIRDGRFVTKGDHNDFVDAFQATEPDIVGRLWIHIPNGGKWLDWLRQPREAALATALLGLVVGTGIRQTRKRMRRRRTGQPVRGGGTGSRTRSGPRRARVPIVVGAGRGVWDRVAMGAAALALAGLVLLAVASTRPVTQEAVETLPFTHAGVFGYEAPATGAADMLPEGMRDGGPVFYRLAERMRVEFAYALRSELPADVRGTARLSAVLTEPRGWRHEIELAPRQTFDGGVHELRGTLDLRRVESTVQRFIDETGAPLPSYQVTLTAEVEVSGELGGEPLRDVFLADFPFDADSVSLRPQPGGDGATLTPTREGAVERVRTVPATVDVWRLSAPVADVSRAGGAVAAGAGLVLLVALAARRTSPAERPSERLARRYGGRLLDVARVEPRPDERLVRMTAMKDLVRVADNLEAPILHLAEGDRHRYLVQEGDTTYVYELDDVLGGEVSARLAPLPAPLLVQPPRTPVAPGAPAVHPPAPRLPAPVVEIDLDEPLPPAAPPGSGGSSLPPAPRRAPRTPPGSWR